MPLKKKGRWPCGICTENCISNCVQCCSCNVWYHDSCQNLSKDHMNKLGDKTIIFMCARCCAHENGNFDYISSLKRLNDSVKNSKDDTLQNFYYAVIQPRKRLKYSPAPVQRKSLAQRCSVQV